MAEPQSHEWSATQPTEVAESHVPGTPRPKSLRGIFWWYLTRICTLVPLILILSLIAWGQSGQFRYFGPVDWLILIARIGPLAVALIFHFVPRPTMRVIAHGASVLAGTVMATGMYFLIADFMQRMHVWLLAMLVLDFIVALFCAYSSGHLTAEFLRDMQRRKRIEQQLNGLADGEAADVSGIGSPATGLRVWQSRLVRLLAILPVPLLFPILAVADAYSWGGMDLPTAEIVGSAIAGGACLIGIFCPLKTLRLLAAGIGAMFSVYLSLWMAVFIYDDHWAWPHRSGVKIGMDFGVVVLGLICVAMAVMSIRQTIRIYQPEKLFLPGDDLESFEAMGRWDEGGEKSG